MSTVMIVAVIAAGIAAFTGFIMGLIFVAGVCYFVWRANTNSDRLVDFMQERENAVRNDFIEADIRVTHFLEERENIMVDNIAAIIGWAERHFYAIYMGIYQNDAKIQRLLRRVAELERAAHPVAPEAE